MQADDEKVLMVALTETFGGVPSLTKALRVTSQASTLTEQAVHKWCQRGRVPWRWRSYVARLAEKHAIEVPKGFGG